MEYICEICTMNCYNEDMLQSHLRLHSKNKYYCLDCGSNPLSAKFYRSFREYKSHMKQQHNEVVCENMET